MNQHVLLTHFGDVVDVFSGFAFKSEQFNTDGDGLPLVRIRDVIRGHSDTYFRGDYDKQFLVHNGDLLVGMDGEFNRQRWRGGPALLNQRVCRLTPKLDQLDADYLFHLLPQILSRIEDATPFVTVKHLSSNELRSVEIVLPPLDEQRRIAATLDKADALRQKRKHAIALLDSLTHSIFLEMFGQLPDAVNIPFADAVYFQEGPGVRNWQFRDEGVKLINVRNLVDGTLVTENTGRYLDPEEANGKYHHFLLSAGDLVMASSGVTWGKIAEVGKNHLPLCLNTSMIRVRPLEGFTKAFVRCFIEGGLFRSQIEKLITGSAQPNFGPSHLRQVTIPAPAAKLQKEFEFRTMRILAVKEQSLQAAYALDSLFASLQHRAFSGQL